MDQREGGMNPFVGGRAVLGTRHGKGEVIVPIVSAGLGISVDVLDTLDTDSFGTFTGEIPRVAGPRDTAFAKARAALAESPEASIGIASEGSFGPHLNIPFVPGGVELVVLVHRDGFGVVGVDVTADTNYGQRDVRSLAEAVELARLARFPEHALIVGPPREEPSRIRGLTKGIVSHAVFERAVTDTLTRFGLAHVETDMRAFFNPTRMASIARATHDLVARAHVLCPACSRPGYAVVKRLPGVPCSDCGVPTHRLLSEVLRCEACGHGETRPIVGALSMASPYDCPECNP